MVILQILTLVQVQTVITMAMPPAGAGVHACVYTSTSKDVRAHKDFFYLS